MDKTPKFEIDPLSLEKEFKVQSVRTRLYHLSREEIEDFLAESLSILIKLAHQTEQMKEYIEKLERGKNR
jgi:hypothetical protein